MDIDGPIGQHSAQPHSLLKGPIATEAELPEPADSGETG